ncbi:unnamed protein product [Toxocara canis]|uniref:Dentin sialophosphoprotein-like n=1 Tax=Toxocara canis TaxID=6265 RepID=A0A183V1H5_TOXCA|nr:unnamed protein product [Toxocara canis]
MSAFHTTTILAFILVGVIVPVLYASAQLDAREKRHADVDVKKATSEQFGTAEGKLIFKKDDDEESNYDDPTIRDMDKRSPGGHRRKPSQESDDEISTSTETATDVSSTSEAAQDNTNGDDSEVETDAEDVETNGDDDGSTSDQTNEDQSDSESGTTREESKRDHTQTDEAENYETDFDATNNDSKMKKRSVRMNEEEKRNKRTLGQVQWLGVESKNDEWGLSRLRPQRHVNLPDAVGTLLLAQLNIHLFTVIRVKRVSRAGSSHKKNKLNERRGNVNRGEDNANSNSNTFANTETNPEN